MLKSYKIGIEIAAINSVGPVLKLISKDMLGLGKQAKYVSSQIKGVRIAAIGAAAALGGMAILKASSDLATYGNRLANVQSRLRQMGVSARNVGALTNAAFTQSMRTPNVDWSDALAALTKGRTVLGSSAEAVRAAPLIVRAEGVLSNWGMGGPTALGELLKAIELRGGTYGPDGKTFSVGALGRNLNYALEAQNIAGKLLTPNQIMRATKLAGAASQMMGGFAWWSSMAEAVQQMGPSGGRGFGMVMKALSGGPISRMYAYNMKRYGLVAPGGFVHIPHTFQTAIKPGALKGSKILYSQGLFAWTQKVLVPTLEAHGVHGKKNLLAAVYQTISSQTGSRLVANMITNALSYIRTQKQMRQAGSVSVYGVQMATSMTGPLHAFEGAWTSMLEALGTPLVKPAIAILNAMTRAVTGVTKWSKVHPAMVRDIVGGIAGLGVALVGLGTGAVLVGLATAGAIPATIAGAVAAIAAGTGAIIANFNGIKTVFHDLGNDFRQFNHWLLGLERTINGFLEHPIRSIGSGLASAGHALATDIATHPHGMLPAWDPAGRQPAVPYGSGVGALVHGVHITNPHDIAKAVHHGLGRSMNRNQSGTTGYNGRVSAAGSPAYADGL